MKNGDNVLAMAETDNGYAEFAAIIENFDRTKGRQSP